MRNLLLPISLTLLCLASSGEAQSPATAPSSPPRIALIGDSTMATYERAPADRPDLTGWGQVFGDFFVDGVKVLNHARSGASSKSFMSLGLWKRTVDAGADYLFIQFGHNDQPGKGDRTTDPNGDFRDNLRRYVDEARAHGMRPILVTPVARRTFADGRPVSSLPPYAEAVKAVAAERKVPLVDLHASSFALFRRLGDAASAGFSPNPTDRTHWSRKGAVAIAERVADALPVAVPELRPFLRPRPQLPLPPQLFAVSGVETAVYDYNAVLSQDPTTYRLRVSGTLGRTEAGRWNLIPTAGDAGDHPLKVEALDASGKVVETGETTLRVVPANAGSGRKVRLLVVGDSLTHASLYANELARLLSQPGNPEWTMMGTHRPAGAAPGVAHEGYGGWTWANFVRKYAPEPFANGRRQCSPFLFPGADGKPALDVARYFQEHCGGERPDYITVMLGINDCFGLKPDDPTAIDAGIEAMFREAEILLAAFRKAAPEAEIGVCLTTPGNSRDEAFRANYQERYPRWGWKRIQHRLVQRQIEQFGGREPEKIFLVPTHLTLDPVDGYPDNNAVHPNAGGYKQIGGSIYAWLKSRLASK